MTHHLILEVQRTDGILLRVLGLAERRGWQPISFSADPGDEDTFDLMLSVRGDRPIELLIRQLNRLFDVLFVEIELQASGQVAL